MSRNSDVVSSPVTRTLSWKNKKVKREDVIDENGKKGKKDVIVRETGWYYYDKTANDGDGDNIKVDLPLNFLWLESAQSFSGYSEKKEQGIYSNEILVGPDAVKKYGKRKLTVKCGDSILEEGYYHDIKEAVKGHGGKFCIPVYAMVENDGNWEIWRFLMTGASGAAWMSFNNRTQNEKMMISCIDSVEVEMKTGAVYEAPVFKYIPTTANVLKEADEKCKEVDKYFEYILGNNIISTPALAEMTEEVDDTDL